jgi:hypothetical protein
MGADSVLVNAALRLGMSRVPGDTAEIFNKQYEGLIAYNQAKADTIVAGTKALLQGGMAITNVVRKKQGKELLEPLDFEGEKTKAYLAQKGKNKANEEDGKGEKKDEKKQETTEQIVARLQKESEEKTKNDKYQENLDYFNLNKDPSYNFNDTSSWAQTGGESSLKMKSPFKVPRSSQQKLITNQQHPKQKLHNRL